MKEDKAQLPVRVALVGNPNVGKSTLFNTMTGLRRHTGNWTGKTLDCAVGVCRTLPALQLVDLPGMYALHGEEEAREEEREALAYLQSGKADAALLVCDAGALPRNLLLVLQLLRQTSLPLALLLNLCGEARAHGTEIDAARLSEQLGVPVYCVEAYDRRAIASLAADLYALVSVKRRRTVAELPVDAAALAKEVTRRVGDQEGRVAARLRRDARLDRVLLGRLRGYGLLLCLLALLLWLTMVGANEISDVLGTFLGWMEAGLWRLLDGRLPPLLLDFLLNGVVRTVFWVVGVMLPPMAIFFPLFTVLEDVGYLPRMALLLDRPFARCHSCGKQALTVCMGLGCNSVGVTGCRIIESKRERTLAILTNSLTPCNGRLPTLTVLITLFLAGRAGGDAASALWLLLALLLSMGMTMLSTALLSRTLYRGERSSCLLELPPFRRPRIRTVLRCAVLDRTVRILCRAVVVSVPAGGLLWLGTHVYVGEEHLLWYLCEGLAPVGRLLGMDGSILAAFLLALPANELFLPILIMLYQGGASMVQIGSYEALGALLAANGWTLLTALCTLFFVMFHWPCATTLLTVYKESRSLKTTLLAAVVPTGCGILLCAVTCLVGGALMRWGVFK